MFTAGSTAVQAVGVLKQRPCSPCPSAPCPFLLLLPPYFHSLPPVIFFDDRCTGPAPSRSTGIQEQRTNPPFLTGRVTAVATASATWDHRGSSQTDQRLAFPRGSFANSLALRGEASDGHPSLPGLLCPPRSRPGPSYQPGTRAPSQCPPWLSKPLSTPEPGVQLSHSVCSCTPPSSGFLHAFAPL